jgi:NAD(P)H-hydrate epimerase
VALLAGSSGYTGAATMAAMAAEASLRSGAGLVTLGCPRTLQPILAGKLTEVITRPFADTGEGSFGISGFEEALAFLNGARAGVIGPGISRNPETLDFARRIMRECTTPLIVDADALFALAGHDALLRERGAATILTPHSGEFARLTGNRIGDAADERIAAARAYAEAHGVHVVLKGAPTITASPSSRVVITNTGNPGMATAGSGDVLSGVLAALLAQGVDADAATWMGTHIHGMAGDRAAQETGMPGLIATDLLRAIALVLRDLAASSPSGI